MLKRLIFSLLLLIFGISVGAQDSISVLDSVQYQNRAAVLLEEDTLFFLYDHINGITPAERAALATAHISSYVHSASFIVDSFSTTDMGDYSQILYRNKLVCNITGVDGLWYGKSAPETAREYASTIRESSGSYRSTFNIKEILKQIGLALVVVIISGLIIRYVNRFFKYLATKAEGAKGNLIHGLKIRTYEVLDEDRFISILLIGLNVLRILFLVFIFYLTLPVVLTIFPWTEGIADMLFSFILDPFRSIIHAIVEYIPNLFTIAIIFLVIRFIARGISYLASEVRTGKLKMSGFYPDWAIPTSRIINFVLYMFMLVLIWPYLPGSGSPVFQGVSVFLGLLISIGSSSAISNIIAGVVITYMRPFKVGDRVRIGEVNGDVLEKSLLVTRIKTIKNEIITVPNSQILSAHSINYSTSSDESAGLIVHSTVTIGYDVPWRKVHQMLIEAALITPCIEENPVPFVLQTSLDDFYVSYQVNAYTKSPAKQAMIYSDLHALIQDIFAKNDVEIMSPHYRAEREGPSTIPPPNGNGNGNDEQKPRGSKPVGGDKDHDPEFS